MTTPTTQTPQEFVIALCLGPADHPELKRIGYWRALENPDDPIPEHVNPLGSTPLRADGGYEDPYLAAAFMALPWPGHHLDPSMPHERRVEICKALNAAPVVASYCGNSRSRLQPMGFCGGAERSNGEWVWPVGLHHYVMDHGLLLCDEFLASLDAFRDRAIACHREPWESTT